MLTYLILIFAALFLSKNIDKRIVLFFVFLLLLNAYMSESVIDLDIYKSRFDNADLYKTMTEPLFSLYVLSFKNNGFSFNDFRLSFLIFYFINLYIIIQKFKGRLSFVLGAFAIVLYCYHVSWIRLSTAYIFAFWFFYYLVIDNYKKAIFFLVLSTLFHAGTFILAIFLVERLFKKYSELKLFVFSTILSIVFFIFVKGSSILGLTTLLISSSKAETMENTYSLGIINNAVLYRVGVYVIIGIFSIYILKNIYKILLRLSFEFDLKSEVMISHCIYRYSIVSLSITGLIPFFDDFYRTQLYMMVLYFISFSFIIYRSGIGHFLKSCIFVYLCAVFYFYIGRIAFNDVFLPLFNV